MIIEEYHGYIKNGWETLKRIKKDQPIKSSEINNKQDKETSSSRVCSLERKDDLTFYRFCYNLGLFLILFILIFVGFGAVVGVGKAYLDSTLNLMLSKFRIK